MLANNPFAQQMMNNNPMMREVMNNPEVLRQLADPATMQNWLKCNKRSVNFKG